MPPRSHEDAHKESGVSRRSSTLSDSLNEIRFHCDAEGRFEQVSLEWVQWMGLGIEDVSGKSWIAFVTADRRPEAEAAWRDGIARRSTVEIETLFRDRHGDDVPARVRFLPCLDSLGELFGFAARLAPHRARSASRSEIEGLEAVASALRAAGASSIVVDAKGRILGGEVSGAAIEESFPEVEPWSSTWAELAGSEIPHLTFRSGEAEEVQVTGAVLADGSMEQAVVRRSGATPAAQRRLYSSLEAAGLLCRRLSHDLNNSLAIIAGYADLVTEDVPAELSEDAGHLRQRIGDTVALCQALHQFVEPGPVETRFLSLERFLVQLLPLLRAAVGQRMVVELDVDPLPRIEIDAHRLEILLLNLAIETRKFEKNGRLSFRGRVSDGAVDLLLDFESDESQELPLAVVEPLARTLGLDFTRDARSVVLRFPAASPALDAGRHEARQESGAARREGVRVLVAEDEKVTRDLISRRLRSAGYAVTVAADGEQALDLYEALEHEVDIVVTDILMPNKDGVSLARELKERTPELKMLMISGQKSAADRLLEREVLLVGTPVMQKPFSSETLVSEIHDLLARPVEEHS